jgi:hypothetical protein
MEFLLKISFQRPPDPVPHLILLRKQSYSLTIICTKPVTAAQENYLKLFEEFRPTFLYRDESDSSTGEYDLSALDIPIGPFAPVSGEFFHSLCDYTILDHAKQNEECVMVDYAHPPERQFAIEDEWPAAVFEATSLFIYPTFEHRVARHVFSKAWPKLKLIIFHNSDYYVDYKGLVPFLESHPKVYVWAQNSTRWHPHVRPLPIGEQNRVWRGGDPNYEPTNTISRQSVREINILAPYWSYTNDIRHFWTQQVVERKDIVVTPNLEKKAYLKKITQCRALVCPPGNGYDTHRCWDALTKGAWAIVHDNAHTQTLLEQYPSLHLIPVEDMTCPIEIPEGLPPFHPLLLREFWRILFRSYTDQVPPL